MKKTLDDDGRSFVRRQRRRGHATKIRGLLDLGLLVYGSLRAAGQRSRNWMLSDRKRAFHEGVVLLRP
jgi:hypothetical protein